MSSRAEKKSEEEIRQFVGERGTDIAAIIVEPIQGEGVDSSRVPDEASPDL